MLHVWFSRLSTADPACLTSALAACCCRNCFDFGFYKAHNPDLPKWGPETIWDHFVLHGQHEGRVFRWGMI